MRALLLLFIVFIVCSVNAQDIFSHDIRVEDKSELLPGENEDQKIKQNFFLKAEVSKRECYAGENIMAVFKAYSRLEASSEVVQRPSLTGFSVIEMVDAYNTLPETEKYDGIYYNTHLIRKVQLFPLQPGKFTLEAAEIESTVRLFKQVEQNKITQSRFRRSFRKNMAIYKHFNLETPPVEITVKPLPEKGQPEDFSGAVGKFEVNLVIADDNIRQYQPLVAKLIIEGTGNIPLITDPEIAWPDSKNISDPQVDEQVNKYEFPLSGRKIFEYKIPTQDTGHFTIPPVKFSYFDPSDKKYKTVSTREASYTIRPSEKIETKDIIITGKKSSLPIHYIYFGIIAFVIITVVIFQIIKNRKKK